MNYTAQIRLLLADRDPGKTICPSEVARSLSATDWRDLMEPIRQAAFRMADAGEIDITQHGHPVDGRTAKGPIRLRHRKH